jgi:hypothetical protein
MKNAQLNTTLPITEKIHRSKISQQTTTSVLRSKKKAQPPQNVFYYTSFRSTTDTPLDSCKKNAQLPLINKENKPGSRR